MLRTILVGLDLSAYSETAVELAIRWATGRNVALAGLVVVDEPTIRRGQMVPLGASAYKEMADQNRLTDARTSLRAALDRFRERCGKAAIPCTTVETEGLPYEEVVLEAQRHDLVFLGQKSFFHFETQDEAGDTLRNVLKRNPRPVVAVPAELHGGEGVVIAYDVSVQAARALQAFQMMGLLESEKVHVVSVAVSSAEAASRARVAVDFLRTHDVDARPVPIVSSRSAAELILEQVDHLRARLLVMGSYGEPLIKQFFLGSVTRYVLDHSAVPLFLYH